jgi:hypothetical protein
MKQPPWMPRKKKGEKSKDEAVIICSDYSPLSISNFLRADSKELFWSM